GRRGHRRRPALRPRPLWFWGPPMSVETAPGGAGAPPRRGGGVQGTRRADDRASTRERLLEAGERLFAERGLDGVSVRMITAAAGANTAAIHYHFGSKEALVRAILERRAAELGARRAELLDRIERDHAPTLRDVVAALVIPPAELAADHEHGGEHYIGFL